jgi:hypothetical protein
VAVSTDPVVERTRRGDLRAFEQLVVRHHESSCACPRA